MSDASEASPEPGSETPTDGTRDLNRLATLVKQATIHGPVNWESEITPEELYDHATTILTPQLPVIVMSVDVRSSTILMREAIRPFDFAFAMTDFVEYSQELVKENGGWFDKFTGDGFLAYWITNYKRDDKGQFIVPTREDGVAYFPQWPYVSAVAKVGRECRRFFSEEILPRLKVVTQNYPDTAGLSIGVDGGLVSPVLIAGELTLLGPPVVGAVRMTSAAKPGEALINNHLGSALENVADEAAKHGVRLRSTVRKTKEYKRQVVYVAELFEPGTVVPGPPTRLPGRDA